jgi:FkbM family methyltransferase
VGFYREKKQELAKAEPIVGRSNARRVVLADSVHRDARIEVRRPEFAHPLHMTTSPADVVTLGEVVCDEVYKLPDRLRRRINGKAIVDLGAFIGITPAYFATQHPDSPVLGIEPLARNFRLFEENAAHYGEQIVTKYAAVLGDATPAHVVRGSGRHPYVPLFLARNPSQAPTRGDIIQPTVLTPEDLVAELDDVDQVGLLKVDIEGAEKDVFGSPAIGALLKRVGVLVAETHDRYVPGCSEIVHLAATAQGMEPFEFDQHTAAYVHPSF